MHPYRPRSLAWAEAVQGWTGLRVAAGCRLHDVAKWLLQTGRAGCDQAARESFLVETSLEPSPWRVIPPVHRPEKATAVPLSRFL